ncbi:MAG: ABC transporter ATP-binding protein [Anaerovoracaceae bacterium]
MKDLLLDVKDLSVIYKTDLETVYAVNHVDLQLKKGQTLGLIGETGAGKTTTALAILRLLAQRTAKVTSGEIWFNGTNLSELSEKDMCRLRGEKISMIFQDPMTALNPIFTIGEQIAEALQFHNRENLSKEQIDKRVEEVLEMVGIPASRKGEYPHQFSGGMKQRVVIAIALACEPELLIADEPTSALDVTIQAQVISLMKGLRRRLGTSMIMITHDFGIIAQTCDYVAVMYAGEIVETGTAEDLFEGEHHHPYTEGLFQSIPNLSQDAKRLMPIEGAMPDPTEEITGCRFAPRCKYCMEICKTQHPRKAVDGSHVIVCHRFGKEEA